MPASPENDEVHSESEEEDDENDYDGFDEDMEALRRACILTGITPAELNGFQGIKNPSDSVCTGMVDVECNGGSAAVHSESESDEDFELVRSIRNRVSLMEEDREKTLSFKSLSAIHPFMDGDEMEDEDFETLRAVQRRFEAYNITDPLKNGKEDCSQKQEHTNLSGKASENRGCENISDSLEGENDAQLSGDAEEVQLFGSTVQHQSDACKFSMLPLSTSTFPKSAQVFIDAIKKNRSCQKFIRTKLTQIEARLEENKKLRQHVKILKDFQVSCKRLTGRTFSQRNNPCIQLISARDSKADEKKVSAFCYGPLENSHVANYKAALAKFPITLRRNKWTEVEKQNLAKGIRQQFQKMLLQGSEEELYILDNILTSIRDLEITPEQIREFLPKVNWDVLASLYVTGRSGAECKARIISIKYIRSVTIRWKHANQTIQSTLSLCLVPRWLNFEDPLINRNPWNVREDKHLLHILKEKGITNWFDIAISLGTNRTPYQCLARFQRSLNACILKREWSKEEDTRLLSAVQAFGENNWQEVAGTLEGRTGTQCSNRWTKSLHPDRQKVGRWARDEDKRLRVAAMLFGQKNWNEIAKFVPGRTQVQCRERWVNSLDPSVHLGRWTVEEDSQLQAAIAEHGYCWSKVASCLPSRTDNQCWRRWKVLDPEEVFRCQQARRIQKLALIGNFVGRESERPALGANDFKPTNCSAPQLEIENRPRKTKRRLRKKSISNRREQEIRGTTTRNQDETVCDSQLSPSCKPVDKNKKDKRLLKRKSRKRRSRKKDGDRTSLVVLPSESPDSGMTNESITGMYGQDFTSTMRNSSEDAGVDRDSVNERRKSRKRKIEENINDFHIPLQIIKPGNTDDEDITIEQIRRRQKRAKKTGPKCGETKQIEKRDEEEDDILLSSLLHKKGGKKRKPKPKEREPNEKSYSCESAIVPFEVDGCESDIPLASFRLKRCKKKSNKNKTVLSLAQNNR